MYDIRNGNQLFFNGEVIATISKPENFHDFIDEQIEIGATAARVEIEHQMANCMYQVTEDNELVYNGRKVAYLLNPDLFQAMMNNETNPDVLILKLEIEKLKDRIIQEHEIASTAEHTLKTVVQLLDRNPDPITSPRVPSVADTLEARQVALRFLKWKNDFLTGRLRH